MFKLLKYFFILLLLYLFTQITVIAQKNNSKDILFDSICFKAINYIYKDIDSATYFANNAMSYAKNNNYADGKVFANITIASITYAKKDYISALKIFVEEEKKAVKIKKNTIYHYFLYTNLASIYFNNQEYEISLSYNRKALYVAKKLNNNYYIITSFNNIAGGLINLNDFEQASNYYDSLLNCISINNIKYDDLPSIYLNIARLSFLKKEYLIAEKYYSKAEIITKEEKYSNYKIVVFQKIMHFNIEMKNYSKAEYYFNKINDSLLNNKQYAFNKENLFFDAYRIYQAKEDYKSALFYLEECYEILDSIYSDDLDEIILEYKIKYELDEVTNKSKVQEGKLQQQKLSIIILSIFVIIFITLISSLFILLKQKNKLNKQLKIINDELEEKNAEIYSNLNYASEVQKLIIKNIKITNNSIEYFIVDKPKFKVGGDFYLFKEKDNKLYIVLADCTGHGISGAFLSNLAYFYLLQAIEKNKTVSEILMHINNKFYDDISNNDFLCRDSLCLTVLCIDNNNIYYSGSKAKLWHYNYLEKKLFEIKLSSTEIAFDRNAFFEMNNLKRMQNDIIFLSSDGFPDQFGSEGKMKYNRFRNLLTKVAESEFKIAKKNLELELDIWKGNFDQTDDILTIGIKIL